MCLFGGFKCDLYDLHWSIALAELFNVFHLTELQQNLIQLVKSDAAWHVANHYLVSTEMIKQIRNRLIIENNLTADKDNFKSSRV